MLKDMVSLSNTVLSFETVLKIEYEETNTKRVVANAIRKLESAYSMGIAGKSLYDLEAENVDRKSVV